jgi:hypothetical protein
LVPHDGTISAMPYSTVGGDAAHPGFDVDDMRIARLAPERARDRDARISLRDELRGTQEQLTFT